MALIFDAILLILIGKEVIPPLFIKLSITILCAVVILTTFTPLSIHSYLFEVYYLMTIVFLISIPVLIFQALRTKRFGILGKNNMVILQFAFIFDVIYVVNLFLYYTSILNNFILADVSITTICTDAYVPSRESLFRNIPGNSNNVRKADQL
jgi:hypothetical protein